MAGHSPSDPGSALKGVQLIHTLLTSGMVIFGIVIFVVISGAGGGSAEAPAPGDIVPPDPDQPNSNSILLLVAGVMSFTTVLPILVFGTSLVRKVLSNPDFTMEQRASRYAGTRLMLAALVEGPGLFWGVLALIAKDPLYLSGLGFSIFVMMAIAPRAAEWEDAGFDLQRPLEA